MSPAKSGPFRQWLSRVLLGWTVDDLRAEAHDAFADESHNHDEGHEHGGEGWFDDAFRDFETAVDHERTHDNHGRDHRDLEDLPADVEELDDEFRELERRVVLIEQAHADKPQPPATEEPRQEWLNRLSDALSTLTHLSEHTPYGFARYGGRLKAAMPGVTHVLSECEEDKEAKT